MKFILIFGPMAVGKMTVGQELQKLTGIPLFHNHMTIEMVLPFFEFGSPEYVHLVNLYRTELFDKVSKSDGLGMIFTYVWAFNHKSDWDFVEKMTQQFKDNDAEIYFVELEADLGRRVERNKTPNRLLHKPSKRDIEQCEKRMIAAQDKYRMNSNEGEITENNYIRIDSTNLSAEETAALIKKTFKI